LLKNEKDILKTLKKIEHISSQKLDHVGKNLASAS
jgi:hypothetical protein